MTEKQFRSRALNWTKRLLYASVYHVGKAVDWLDKYEQGKYGKYSEHYVSIREAYHQLKTAVNKFKEIK